MVVDSEGDAEASMIVEGSELEEAVRGLMEASEIAFDCEGDGYFRYRARLCAVQLADRRSTTLVDTLNSGVQALAPLLGEAGPLKVVHDAAYDARLLRDHGARLGNVFDTSVAGRFLGEPALGLRALLQKHLEVDVPKEHQLADWGARPLSDEMRSYLENDVRYLLALADR